MTTTTPNAADAVEVQQARQDRLEELYHQDGRQDPSHPMHGLYTGLVQTTSTTTPENAMADEFMFLTLNQKGTRIAIRKSSVHTFFESDSYGTIVEYTGDSAGVKESFDEVCRLLGVAASTPQSQPSENEISAVEALRRLRRWGGMADDSGINGFVMNDVVDWIDKGMKGPLPPLPDYLVLREAVNYSLEEQS